MRLLKYDHDNKLCITRDLTDDQVEPYAILSHTWGQDEDEVIFHEIGSASSQKKPGHMKIDFCGRQALRDGWQHFWVDTCCIDKANHTELSKAITSMHRWYQQAQVCYVYLADVSSPPSECGGLTDCSWQSSFRQSRWFTRGWTLQELLAPRQVVFYSKDWAYIGTRNELKELLHDITGIPISALDGQPLSQFPVTERMRWARNRQTKEKEDRAYCLLGILGVYMYLNYGEGDYAYQRLQREIDIQHRGDNVTNLHGNPDADSGIKPLGLCLTSAPYIQPDLFVGRAAEMERIHNLLWPEHAPPEQRRVLLGGIGGVGKTQLAIAYARQYYSSYKSVLWLNAASEQTLNTSIRSVAKQIMMATELEKIDSEQVLTRVHVWLSHPQNSQWLLIFDNHDHPDQFDVSDFCPSASHGSVIITTRLPDEVDGESVRIQPLEEICDSLDILQRRSRREGVKSDLGARALAKRLAGLPIALVTAGAYLANSDVTFQEYLDAYEQRWQVGRPSPPQEYKDHTLYNTWNLTYSRLETEDTEAAEMLKLLAYFDPQEFWYELFQDGLLEPLSGSVPPTFLADRINFGDVMGKLVKYCLVEIHRISPSYTMYSMHGCVHDWTLRVLNQHVDPQLYRYAFHCVYSSIKGVNWGALGIARYTRVSRHAVQLTHHHFEPCFELCLLEYDNAATCIPRMLKEQSQLSAAEWMYTKALACSEQKFGPDYHSTLMILHWLANLLDMQGKSVEAEHTYAQALTRQQKALGPEHSSTLATMHHLSNLYRRQGKLTAAEQMDSQALARYEKIYEREHISNLDIYFLGDLYIAQGKLALAEQMYTQGLDGYEREFGPEHILTLQRATILADLYYRQGDKLIEAEQIYTRVLAEFEKLYGNEHQETLALVHRLGNIYDKQGKQVEAEQMYTQALAGFEKIRGPHHVGTLHLVDHLSILYFKQDKVAESEQMYTRLLTGYEELYGPKHNSTLDVVHRLGHVYDKQGKQVDAEQMYTRALAECERVHGLEHEDTLHLVGHLSILYFNQSRSVEAEQMFMRQLVGLEKLHGSEHVSTLDVVHYLGHVYDMQDKVADAEQMYSRALAGDEKLHGPEGEKTLKNVLCLGQIYYKQEKREEAEQMYARALTGYEAVHGTDHEMTLQTVLHLGILYRAQGRPVESEQMYTRAISGYEKLYGPEHDSYLYVVYCLGSLYRDQIRLAEAEQMYARALAGYEKTHTPQCRMRDLATRRLRAVRRARDDAESQEVTGHQEHAGEQGDVKDHDRLEAGDVHRLSPQQKRLADSADATTLKKLRHS